MERLYFDGDCGFCHGWVRWIARREPPGGLFRFAPLGGPTFEARVPADRRAGMAGTIVVETGDGRFLVRSEAVLHVLRRLGLRRTAGALALLPRALRDLGYRAVARTRRRDACPADAPVPGGRLDP
jgi:predicted DCC family thiol-disulfide oxidoreductase YuxK